MQLCPCGTGQSYLACCGAFIEGEQKPSTPESLMRSRYTAYTQTHTDYLLQTAKSPAKDRFNAEWTREWAKQVEWIGLAVKATSIASTQGFVEFIAYFKERGKLKAIHELSEFHYEHHTGYYVDGKQLPLSNEASRRTRIGRNHPCVCGSKKKYKHCCL